MKLVINIITMSAIALLTAACSGADSGSGSYGSYGSAPAAKKVSNSWKTTNTSKGAVFSDQSGKSLYTFTKDAKGVSNCYESCAAAWPPFAAGNGAKNKGGWTVVSRKDGSKQWALNGQPLYYFAADKAAGDVRGDGLNGVWFLARPGSVAKAKPAPVDTNGY